MMHIIIMKCLFLVQTGKECKQVIWWSCCCR